MFSVLSARNVNVDEDADGNLDRKNREDDDDD
jgi:hypothetical protein